MLVTLVRHGVTAWNAARRFQGHSDVELSDEGRAQARAVAARLKGERIDRVYASDLSRALETARILAAPHGLTVRSDPRLREFDFGAWEGLTWDEIVRAQPHLAQARATHAAMYAPQGGETFAAVCTRVGWFFDELQASPAEHVAIVMHAGPLHATLAVLGLSPPQGAGEHGFRFSPAGLSRLAMDAGQARLITVDDVRHLDPAG